MNRRDFINLMSFEAALLLLTSQAKAESLYVQPPKKWGHDNWEGFFVSIVLDGAWDVSLSMDPWTQKVRPDESDYFIEYTEDKLIPFGKNFVGPALEVMKPHFKDMSLVNGVFMSTNDNGHESLKNYGLTGDVENKRAAFSLELALTLPPTQFSVLTTGPLPTGIRPNRTTQTSMATQSLTGSSDDLLSEFIDGATSGILTKVREAQKEKTNLTQATQLRGEYVKTLQGVEAADEMAITAASFKTGLARTAVLEPRGNLDTHSGHPGLHMTEQIKGWNYINSLFNLFKKIEYKNGVSLFDMTTFMVTSDFSRTPALNAAKGKDHNPWSNSVVLAGRGIAGEQVEGVSALVKRKNSPMGLPYLTGLPYDFKTQQPILDRKNISENSSAILPRHLLRTVSDAMGLNLNVIGGGLDKVAAFQKLIKS